MVDKSPERVWTEEKIVERLNNPSDGVLRVYWDAMPSPYDLDMQDVASARSHLRAVMKKLLKGRYT